jgi:hypothetical protein
VPGLGFFFFKSLEYLTLRMWAILGIGPKSKDKIHLRYKYTLATSLRAISETILSVSVLE